MSKPLSLADWTVLSVGNTQTFGSNGFQKRELVITNTGDKYEQFRVIEALQDKCVDLDGLSPGDRVTVDFWAEVANGQIQMGMSNILTRINWQASKADTTGINCESKH